MPAKNTTIPALSASIASLALMAGAMPALAAEPSAGNQSGGGSTDLTMVFEDSNEHGGYAVDPTNPDNENGDGTGNGLGDNLAFTVPTSINYVASASGVLTGPSNAYIENRSAFPTHVSSMKATPENGWSFVADASASNASNSVDLLIGPADDQLSVAGYTSKRDVGEPSEWNMAATAEGAADQVALTTSGHVSHISADLSSATAFGTVEWYVTPGAASEGSSIPSLPNSSTFGATSVSDFHAIGEYLRSGDADSAYAAAAKSLVGKTVDVALANSGNMTVRLVSVDAVRGLTFESVGCLPTGAVMNASAESNAGGWTDSVVRASLNTAGEGTLFSTYFAGTPLAENVVSVTNSSYDYNGGQGGTVTTSDRFWVPSVNNIFGPGWPIWYNGGGSYSDGASETQFDYYAGLVEPPVSATLDRDDRLIKRKPGAGTGSSWWFRSASADRSDCFMAIDYYSGSLRRLLADNDCGVVPCFCL